MFERDQRCRLRRYEVSSIDFRAAACQVTNPFHNFLILRAKVASGSVRLWCVWFDTFSCDGVAVEPPPTRWRFFLLLGLRRLIGHHRRGRGVSRNQRGVRHHATFLVDQTLCLTEHDNPADHGLEDLFTVPIPDRCEGRVVRHIVIGRRSAEPAIGQILRLDQMVLSRLRLPTD